MSGGRFRSYPAPQEIFTCTSQSVGGKGDGPGFRCGSGLRSGSWNFNFRELSGVSGPFLLVSTCNLQIPPGKKKPRRGNIEFVALKPLMLKTTFQIRAKLNQRAKQSRPRCSCCCQMNFLPGFQPTPCPDLECLAFFSSGGGVPMSQLWQTCTLGCTSPQPRPPHPPPPDQAPVTWSHAHQH